MHGSRSLFLCSASANPAGTHPLRKFRFRSSSCGTGFVSYGRQRGTRIVATAQHVVESAINNESPTHVGHGQQVLTLENSGLNRRFVHTTTEGVDSAILAFVANELPQPTVPILDPASPAELGHIKVGA